MVATERAATCWRAGGVVAFPTETVYGLGAAARNPQAIERVYAAKGRPRHHPLIVHLPDLEAMADWGVANEAAWQLARRFWPGPLTLVLPRAAHVLDALTGGQATVALRVPSHPVALALLRAFGDGVAAPSANRYGHISPTRAEHVIGDYRDDDGLLVIDGGPCGVGVESTIVDCSGVSPRLLRLGGLSVSDIAASLGVDAASLQGLQAAEPPRVPGTLARHYAPRTPTLVTRTGVAHPSDAAVLALRDRPAGHDGPWLKLPTDPRGAAELLYALLRELDSAGAERIELEAVPEEAAWAVIADRLKRAAEPLEELP
jgi:L-threonylcarbamoyladenylate synthase